MGTSQLPCSATCPSVEVEPAGCIALVRLQSAALPDAARLQTLPSPESRYSTVAVGCDTVEELRELVSWRCTSPEVGLCLVLPRSADLLRHLVVSGTRADAVYFLDEMEGAAGLPWRAVEEIWKQGVYLKAVAAVCARLCASVSAPPDTGELLRRIATLAAAGASVHRCARRAGLSPVSMRRWLHAAGLPGPKRLLSTLRQHVLHELVSAGVPLRTAISWCGWTTGRAYRASRQRLARSARTPRTKEAR